MSRKRQGPARWTLPDVIEPPDSVCFQINVPNDKFHVAAFLGAIYDLAKPYKWANDDAHSAIRVGAVWFKIFEALRRGGCEVPRLGGADGDDFMIRQSPDNPCLLENSVDGVTWCTWADLSLCLAQSPPQPGPGGAGPTSGTTKEYCLTLDANGQAILPIAVQENWTLEVVQKQGGWTDGASWYCPNGQSYSLGLCTGVGGFTGGDPLPTALHMAIVAEIDTLFYDGNGLIVVPTGLTDQQVVFQANDASLSDNSGTVQFCVKVTNPPAGPIGITYSYGTGPSSVVSGQVVSMTATVNAGGGANNWSIYFATTERVRVTFVNQSGYVPMSAAHVPYMLGFDPSPTQVQIHYFDEGADPNKWNPATPVSGWVCETGGGAVVWTIQVKIDLV